MKLKNRSIKNINSFLNGLSIDELNDLLNKIQSLIKEKEKDNNMMNTIINELNEKGVDLTLLKNKIDSLKNTKNSNKYQYVLNIEGIDHIYNGKGEKPVWLKEYISNGGKLSTLRVKIE